MKIFDSDVAAISYIEDENLIRTSWKSCEDADSFMAIISQAQDFYELFLPKKTLWDHSHFEFQIPLKLQEWTEENINIPAQKLNVMEKVSFIVSKDAMAQLSIRKIFDETVSEFEPHYFIEEGEALDWLNTPLKENKEEERKVPKIIIDRNKDKVRFSLEVESDDFGEYLHLFTKLRRSRMLSIELAERSLSLTKQERVIAKMLIKGKGNDYISDLLSISPIPCIPTERIFFGS